MSINTHIPLKYCLGFTPFRDHTDKKQIVVRMGEVITQDMIDQYPGDASKYIISIRPETHLEERIKINIERVEAAEEKKIERIIKKIEPGEYLFEQGSEDKTIYIMTEGEVEVLIDGMLVVEIREKGTFIGEMALVTGNVRSASIRALSSCIFCAVEGSDLLAIAQKHPIVLSRMCQSLANKLAHISTELSMLKLFNSTSGTRVITRPMHDDTRFIANLGQFKDRLTHIEKNANLFVEGEMTFDIYILVKGELRVSIGGETIVRITAPGSLVGEMSSLRVKPRSATVTAVTDCDLYKIQGLRLLETCKEDPQFFIKLAQILANRLQMTSIEFVKYLKSNT